MSLGLSQIASQTAAQTLDGAMSASLTKSAAFQAQKIALDTDNAILDSQVDSASKSLNAGIKASKTIQY
ncbi:MULTISPECIES: hypothetical protein [unclassified Brenneria]|uniref:hypothetical protein n=1 Tax=unclassified Brenneria TaxID=2634434 RepID=UPI0029C58120|nr:MULTISPECIES: hypothetical protein [unclassified Brenneria]MDX5626668.1 hypothetical protein [Brenneria sp. L3-3Z]MDX5693982.1 hypothetical protein [Brenneria sp. L4-2C]MEE3661377.1 hypothetical protein [Brenneria sp. g21c3]